MSYNVWVQALPTGIQSLEDIPDEFRPVPLGSRSDIIRQIVQLMPFADSSDPVWGIIDGPDYSVEINLSRDPVECCHFILRGSEAAIGIVSDIIGHLGLPALHSGGDGIFRPEDALSSYQQWGRYRDQVVAEAEPPAV